MPAEPPKPDQPWSRAIDRLLAEKGWTQAQLAQKARLASTRISEIRKSDRPFLPNMQKLATAFNVGLFEFFVNDEQSATLKRAEAAAQQFSQNSIAALQLAIKTLGEQVSTLERQNIAMVPPPAAPVVEATPASPAVQTSKKKAAAKKKAS